MPPKRTARQRGVTPSPAPRQSPAPRNSPAGVGMGPRGSDAGAKAASVRTPMPTKYSTSYGSPMAQLPNRMITYGGANLAEAASIAFATVQQDSKAAEEARRKAEEQRKAAAEKASKSASATTKSQPSITAKDPNYEESSGDSSGDELTKDRPPGKQQETQKKTDKKRPHDDSEDESGSEAERERLEREERLHRERSEEARRRADEKLAKAQEAARKKAERERRTQEAAKKAAEEKRRADEAERQRLAQEVAAREKAEQERLAQESASKKAETGQDRRAREAARKAAAEEKRRKELAAAREDDEEHRRAEEGGLGARRKEEQERRAREAAKKAAAEEKRRAQEEATAKEKAEQERRVREAASQEENIRRGRDEVARQKAEKDRLVAEKAEREAKRPPVPHFSTPGPTIPSRPSKIPGSSKSYIEESEIFDNADLTTPRRRPPVPSVERRPGTARYDDEVPAPSPSAAERTAPRPATTYPGHVPATNSTKLLARLRSSLSPWSILKLLTTAFFMLHVYRFLISLSRPDLFESPVTTIHWYGWGNWKSNIGQFVPSPLLHPLGVLTDTQYDNLLDLLQNQASSTAAAVESLEEILPRMVHVKKDRKTNKLVIDDEFWRAVRAEIMNDSSILTLVDGKTEITDQHWKAIQHRLQKSGELEGISQRAVSKSWEKWLKDNEQKVADVVRKHLPQGTPRDSRSVEDWLRDNEQKVAQIIRKHLPKDIPRDRGHDIHDTVVTRDEFLKELEPILEQNKLTSTKIKELEKLVNQALHQTSSKSGISESRVREIISKEIKSAKLEAAARGEISRFDAELQRQVNHFGLGNGAFPDNRLSSPTWEVTHAHLGSKEWIETMATAPRFLPEPVAALSSWEDAGHCWCAGTQINATHFRPADLVVKLASFVIPQHVVVEHIHPSATLDPGAMPKDIEVWAEFDEYHQRENLINFMEVTFPDSRKRNPDLLARGFVQVGAFEYRYNEKDRGVRVEKLSQELVGLKAATDHVLIRATSNQGAADHTCFYRIRMYGEVVELDPGEQDSKTW